MRGGARLAAGQPRVSRCHCTQQEPVLPMTTDHLFQAVALYLVLSVLFGKD